MFISFTKHVNVHQICYLPNAVACYEIAVNSDNAGTYDWE